MSGRAVAIEVEGLTRSFENVRAVDGISFRVMQGQVVGFIGANGAGKTTTMRMLATLDTPDSGRLRLGGWDVTEYPAEVRRRVGWMPDHYGVYQHVSVFDYLDFYARAYGYAGEERRRRVREVMDFADLTQLADRPMNGLSKGMGQRLCFGRTLLHDPDVLILDEPAAGLDPKARIEFKNLVRLLAERGKTIFISSHILSELGEMCDSLLFIDAGRIVHHGSAESLTRDESAAAVVEIRVLGAPGPLENWLAVNAGWRVLDRRRDGVLAEFQSDEPGDLAVQLRRLVGEGIEVIDFHRREKRLEDAFVELLRKENGRSGPPPLPGGAA